MPDIDQVLPEAETVVRNKGGRFYPDFHYKLLRFGVDQYSGSDAPALLPPPGEGGPLNPPGQNRSIIHRAPDFGDADFGMEDTVIL